MSYESINSKDVVARKLHICDYCGGHINKGEKYHYEVFLYDGDFGEWHSHLACSRIASAIWDYVDPWDGMTEDDFRDGCHDVCRCFICPDCESWNKEDEWCDKDEMFCVDKMDKFFETHELYKAKDGFPQEWKCREKENQSC